MFKIINKFEHVNFQNWFQLARGGWGHSYIFWREISTRNCKI